MTRFQIGFLTCKVDYFRHQKKIRTNFKISDFTFPSYQDYCSNYCSSYYSIFVVYFFKLYINYPSGLQKAPPITAFLPLLALFRKLSINSLLSLSENKTFFLLYISSYLCKFIQAYQMNYEFQFQSIIFRFYYCQLNFICNLLIPYFFYFVNFQQFLFIILFICSWLSPFAFD